MKKLFILALTIAFCAILTSCSSYFNTVEKAEINSETVTSQEADDVADSSSINNESSPIINSNVTETELLEQANILSEQLILYVMQSYHIIDFESDKLFDDLNITSVQERELFMFIATLFIYADDINHPFAHITEFSNDPNRGTVYYDIDKAKEVVNLFFGVENYIISDEVYIDTEKNLYAMPTETSFGNNLNVTVLDATIEDKLIKCNVELFSGPFYEDEQDQKSYGILTVTYEIKSDNATYLQFKNIHNAQ